MREEKHIKFLRFLIEKDGGFGYVQVRQFLLDNFEDGEKLEGRVFMNRFLNFMKNENLIEVMGNSRNGIHLTHENGKPINRNEISAIVRIKINGLELFNSSINNRNNRIGIYSTIIFSVIAFCFSLISLFYQNNVDSNVKLNQILIDKVDSIQGVNNKLADSIFYLKYKKTL